MKSSIKHRAIVTEVAGCRALVRAADADGASCMGCRMSAICSPDALSRVEVDVPSSMSLAPGDRVAIGFSEQLTGRAICLLLAVPLAGLLLGAIAGAAVGGDALAAVGGLVGALLALGVMKLFGRRIEQKSRWRVISKI